MSGKFALLQCTGKFRALSERSGTNARPATVIRMLTVAAVSVFSPTPPHEPPKETPRRVYAARLRSRRSAAGSEQREADRVEHEAIAFIFLRFAAGWAELRESTLARQAPESAPLSPWWCVHVDYLRARPGSFTGRPSQRRLEVCASMAFSGATSQAIRSRAC